MKFTHSFITFNVLSETQQRGHNFELCWSARNTKCPQNCNLSVVRHAHLIIPETKFLNMSSMSLRMQPDAWLDKYLLMHTWQLIMPCITTLNSLWCQQNPLEALRTHASSDMPARDLIFILGMLSMLGMLGMLEPFSVYIHLGACSCIVGCCSHLPWTVCTELYLHHASVAAAR